jgi:hypothetical protein
VSANSRLFGGFRRRTLAAVLIALLCIVVATYAQRGLDHKVRNYRTYVPYGVAAVLFALAFGDVALEKVRDAKAIDASGVVSRCARSAGPIIVFLSIAFLGCLNFGGNRFRLPGLLLWVGGVSLCLLYLYVSDSPKRFGQRISGLLAGRTVPISRRWLLLGLAVGVGALLRLQALDVVPADIGWDLPYNFTDGLSILRGEYRIFFPANLGREGLFFYLIALVAKFSPLSHFSIKLTSALVGIATIPALYLAARRMFPETVALSAAFLLAMNRWHITLSRSGFRVILLPFFAALVLYTLLRALQSYRLFDFGLAGLALGLGLHTYFPFLFAPVAVVAALGLLALSGRPMHWRALLPLLTIMMLVALAVYAPLVRYAIENPTEYIARAALQARLLSGEGGRKPLNLSLLADNMRTTLLMFNVYGDGNSRFNVPAFRHFGFVSGILLVLGCFYALRRWRSSYNGVLLAMAFVFILPSGLMALPNELPNIFRASGAIGPALILAALPLAAVAERLSGLSAQWPAWDLRLRVKISSFDDAYETVLQVGKRSLLLLLPLLAMVVLLVAEYRDTRQFYFGEFVKVLPDRQNVSSAKEMARQIELYGDPTTAFIKVWPHWFDGRALLMYLRKDSERPWNPYLYFSDLIPGEPPLSLVTRQALFILYPEDLAGLTTIREVFPHSASMRFLFPDGSPSFTMVRVERLN